MNEYRLDRYEALVEIAASAIKAHVPAAHKALEEA